MNVLLQTFFSYVTEAIKFMVKWITLLNLETWQVTKQALFMLCLITHKTLLGLQATYNHRSKIIATCRWIDYEFAWLVDQSDFWFHIRCIIIVALKILNLADLQISWWIFLHCLILIIDLSIFLNLTLTYIN